MWEHIQFTKPDQTKCQMSPLLHLKNTSNATANRCLYYQFTLEYVSAGMLFFWIILWD